MTGHHSYVGASCFSSSAAAAEFIRWPAAGFGLTEDGCQWLVTWRENSQRSQLAFSSLPGEFFKVPSPFAHQKLNEKKAEWLPGGRDRLAGTSVQRSSGPAGQSPARSTDYDSDSTEGFSAVQTGSVMVPVLDKSRISSLLSIGAVDGRLFCSRHLSNSNWK